MADVNAAITISGDSDWLALNAYRVALEEIVAKYDRRSTIELLSDGAECASEMSELARGVLEQFPGSFRSGA